MKSGVKRERSSTPAAKRMQLVRQRRRDGEHLIRFHLSKVGVDTLIKKQYLFEADRADRATLEGAVNAFFEDNLFELRKSS
jgi:hypothetical protein